MDNNEIGVWWPGRVFLPPTTTRTVVRYHLLALDRHGSHLTAGFAAAAAAIILWIQRDIGEDGYL